MGLDNMPHEYPCISGDTAVMETITMRDGSTDERIDCAATIKAGGCPFTNANPPEKGRVMGMLGTHCWYRGKYGNWLINALTGQTDDIDAIDSYGTDGDDSFYGTDADGLYRPAEACKSLADQMASALDERGGRLVFGDDDRTDDAKYAIWYLRWVANECEGMDAWY
jgi:hypothetical protein